MPKIVKVPKKADTILKDHIDVPKREKEKLISLMKRPSRPLFSG